MHIFFVMAHYKKSGVVMKFKRFIVFSLLIVALCGVFSFNSVYAESDIYLGGMSVGFNINTRGAYILGVGDVLTKDGLVSPAKKTDVEVGDILLEIDGNEVNSAKDVEKTLKNGKEKVLTIKRDGEELEKKLTPVKDVGGNYRLGLFLRDTVNGIGTITYFKGDTVASLGHPVLDENGELLQIKSGNMCVSCVTGVTMGKRGRPGALHGTLYQKDKISKITKNTEFGVFAKMNDNAEFKKGKKIKVGKAKMGNASIFSTIDGKGVKEYSISIVKADLSEGTNKGLVIKINDETLLKNTGGIVQGMSGSPIVQDGKLVGAVTHVFINDPTRGFGVNIYNMLNNQ